MCLQPLSLYSPARRLYKQGGQQLCMEVRCNKCAVCVESIRKEWSFRTRQETLSTLDKGGYVLYLTLTYDNEHLPRLSNYIDVDTYGVFDFSCFCHEHFRLFLKRLRRSLDYHCGNSQFKYFLTSEYGCDERFTHRPHYHIMFFVTNGVHPLTFCRIADRAWIYGRTDGITYKPYKYVAEHVYGYDLGFGNNSSKKVVMLVSNYVSKYITKPSSFRDKIDSRIALLRVLIQDVNELKSLIRNIDMFHRQSQGFGLSYIYGMDNRSIESLLLNDEILVDDSDDVKITIPVPMYYKRKLFYTCRRRDDGSYYWELTDIGRHFKAQSMLKSVDKAVVKLQDKIFNLSRNNQDCQHYIDMLLNGRTLTDYVVYLKFYKGRMRHISSYSLDSCIPCYGLTDIESNLYDWLNLLLDSSYVNSSSSFDVYDVDRDKSLVVVVGDSTMYDLFNLPNANIFNYDKKQFFKQNSFSEDSCPDFRYFDRLTEYLRLLESPLNSNKQLLFDFQENLKSKFKSLNYGI